MPPEWPPERSTSTVTLLLVANFRYLEPAQKPCNSLRLALLARPNKKPYIIQLQSLMNIAKSSVKEGVN